MLIFWSNIFNSKNLKLTHFFQLLQEKTDQICEMAGVMTKSIQIDDENSVREQEVRDRLLTENKVRIFQAFTCVKQYIY